MMAPGLSSAYWRHVEAFLALPEAEQRAARRRLLAQQEAEEEEEEEEATAGKGKATAGASTDTAAPTAPRASPHPFFGGTSIDDDRPTPCFDQSIDPNSHPPPNPKIGKAAAAEALHVMGSPVDRPCAKYRPVEDACWGKGGGQGEGEPAPYLHMAWAFELLCSTTKRLTKVFI